MNKAIYPGSFDPITNGHIDIVNRASRIFDHITVAIFNNLEKTAYFEVNIRKKLLESVFKDNPKISVDYFDGLLIDYAKKQSVYTVVRGLRAVSDFDYEFQLALTNRRLASHIDTVLFMADEKYSFLSSNAVKQIAKFNGDISLFVPKVVQEAMEYKNHE